MTDAVPDITLRTLQPADLAFADQLRALAGWNQTRTDWERFLQLSPDGCFLAEFDGTPAGTATTCAYGSELAWIGMVLVDPGRRRRGVGRALLLQCMAQLRNRGVRCLGLDATPAGRTVYEPLGFVPDRSLSRWQREPGTIANPGLESSARNLQASDLPAVIDLDASTLGVARASLIEALVRDAATARVIPAEDGRAAAWGLLRAGSRATYLGPVAADSADAARLLLDDLLGQAGDRPVFLDLPDDQPAAVAWARDRGFTVQRSLVRMFAGVPPAAPFPHKLFAIAGPELG